jgi:hypothetical protein
MSFLPESTRNAGDGLDLRIDQLERLMMKLLNTERESSCEIINKEIVDLPVPRYPVSHQELSVTPANGEHGVIPNGFLTHFPKAPKKYLRPGDPRRSGPVRQDL